MFKKHKINFSHVNIIKQLKNVFKIKNKSVFKTEAKECEKNIEYVAILSNN